MASGTGLAMRNVRGWFFTLQFRLILGFTLILVVALGSVSAYLAFTAEREVEAFDQRAEGARNARLERLVSVSFQDQLRRRELQPRVERYAALFDRRIILTDATGTVIVDSARRYAKPWRFGNPEGRHMPLMIGDREVGSMVIAPNEAPEETPDPPLSQLASKLNRSLLWTGLTAGLLGILLVGLVSRRVLVPVRSLSTAAQRLGEGDLSQRVPNSGSSELGQLAQTFNTMAENLQHAEEQRRNLTADVAHELRTPVSNIRGYLEAIKDGLVEPHDTIDIIHQQVLHLSTLIEDLRLLSVAEAGNLRLDIQQCALEQLLDETLEAARPRAQAKGVALRLQEPERALEVRIDRTRISQVATNLVENAIFHTPDGGSVTISTAAEGSMVRVTVADTGEGITSEVLPLVFDRFYRVDSSRTRATGGTGLGLTIAKQLVEAHGGTIWAESSPGQGSCFIFELPLSG